MPSLAIKIDAALAEEARAAAAIADRSLTAQIEHWARMGKKMDEQITGAAMMAFKSAAPGQEVEDQAHRSEVEAVLAKLRQPGYAEMVARASHDLDVHEVLYGADPDGSDWIVAHYRDGRKVKGRMVKRVFVPAPAVRKKARK